VKLDDHIFRHESARLVAALTRAFGIQHLALAEDVVQETLSRAFSDWSHRGVPEHYSALLMASAKNRALDVFRRERTAKKFTPELQRFVESEWTLTPSVDDMFTPDALQDGELRMMFSCCNPRLNEDAQVALTLNLLCGFGVHEIAGAFLATASAVEKRLSRGKKTLAQSKRLFELTADDFQVRLSAVQRALYLLFSEGYHGGASDVIRKDLCHEAMRLVRLLIDHLPSATPTTFALGALMCLDAARLPSRLDQAGNLRTLFEQDRTLWDGDLIAQGLTLLAKSATGANISSYHLEAGIAARHAAAETVEQTRWDEIVTLYDTLMRVSPSPIVALNRAIALAQLEGPARGLAEIALIDGRDRLSLYPFYHAALGELELRLGRSDVALGHFEDAHRLARNDTERRFLEQRIAHCD
jgi:RNA polymerase sigma-70 factor (ECF subfamily)